MKKKILVWMLIAATSIGAVGCGSSKYDSAAPEAAYSKNAGYETNSMDYAATEEMVAYEGDYYDEMGDSPAASVTEDTRTSENASTSNRKLIRDVTLNVETKEYDALIGTLSEEITALGGYIEYMDVHNSSYRSSNTSRNANLTVRIPAAKLDGFLNKMGAETNVTSRTESVRDVTLTYVDMESHKNVLIAERERLLEYLNQAETVEESVGDGFPELEIIYSREKAPLGTAGALRQGLTRTNSAEVLVLNGDSYLDADLNAFLSACRAADHPVGMLLREVDDVSRYGRVTFDENGRVLSFDEKGQYAGKGHINAGIYAAKRDFLEKLLTAEKGSLEKDYFPELARQGKIFGCPVNARFIDIGTPESYAEAQHFFKELEN